MDKLKAAFAKVGVFIKSCFVSVDGRESRMLTMSKKDGVQTVMSSILCAVLGIFVGYFILLCINPQNSGKALGVILKNFLNFKNPKLQSYYFGSTLVKTAPLVLCGLSVLFSYKAGLFNIGVGGQYCMGIGISLYAAIAWQCPWYVCILLAMLAAAVWGAISGAFKALFNVNEVIACIMTNWIALYLVNMMLSSPKVMNPSLSETYEIKFAAPKSIIPSWGLDKAFNNNQYVTIAIILTIIVAVVILVVLNKTTFGYEIKATGLNKYAAKYAGMKDKRNIILTMAISGALAGLAASFYYLTGMEQWTTSSSVPAMGFNGIAVAFLGGLNPIGVLVAAFFVQHITLGGSYIDTTYYNPQIADLIISIIIYLCAFVLFFKQTLKSRLNKVSAKLQAKNIAESGEGTPDGEVVEQAPPNSEDGLSEAVGGVGELANIPAVTDDNSDGEVAKQ